MATSQTFTPAFKLEIAKLMVDEHYTASSKPAKPPMPARAP
jgi:hypothetical protein